MNIQKLLFKLTGLGLNAVSLLSPQKAGRLAYNLFVNPPRPVLRAKDEDFLNTATRKDVIHSGHSVVEYHWGESDNPYVLLSYGWAYNSGRWRYFVPPLVAAGFRVIAYDPPGHGHAPKGQLHLAYNAQIIRSIFETYGQPKMMIGHSFGGASLITALSKLPVSLHPERMVVMAAFSDSMHVFRYFQKGLGLNEKAFAKYIDCIKAEARSATDSLDLVHLTAHLGHIKTMLVHDPMDKVTQANQSQRYHLVWPGSVLYAPLGATHHLGTPRVTNAIIDFLLKDEIPQSATIQVRPLPADAKLEEYFVKV
ncbi:MAG: alpha/beta fold hydrolase [Bacteroidota bacterium]